MEGHYLKKITLACVGGGYSTICLSVCLSVCLCLTTKLLMLSQKLQVTNLVI